MEDKKNYFSELNAIDVNSHTEKKNGLTYLSWAWAWAEVKKKFPDAIYTVYENESGWCYHTDGKTCWVKTGVTVNGIEHIEYLPVMDFRNQSIPFEKVTSFDVNKAIQRSLTKACARHGLGLYIYAGEDLPEDAEQPKPVEKPVEKVKRTPPKEKVTPQTVSREIAKAYTLGSGQKIADLYRTDKELLDQLRNGGTDEVKAVIKVLDEWIAEKTAKNQ